MKISILLIFFFLFIKDGICQGTDSIFKKSITFSVKCYKKKIFGKENLEFVLLITNTSQKTDDIPAEYIFGPIKSIGSDIVYEIYYCDKNDTINVFDSIYSQIHREFLYPQRILLNSGDSFPISFDLNNSAFIFKKKGIYKMKFTLRSSYLKAYLLKDISTEWVFVRLE